MKEKSVQNIPYQKIVQSKSEGKLNRLKSKLLARAIIVMLINVGLIASTFYGISSARSNALAIQELNGEKFLNQNETQARVLQSSILNSAPQLNRIDTALVDDDHFLEFVQDIDVLRREGVLTRFSIESDKFKDPVTGSFGTKLLFEFSGDQGLVNAALQKIYSTNYLFRTEEATLTKREENQITYTIIGILYVKN